MIVLLAATSALTGVLVAWAAGIAWEVAGLPAATTAAGAVAAGTAAVLDLTGRLRPLAVRRQVPQLWGRLFGPRLVAVLYGARLGIGPATILSSWLWWASFLVGAACGPWVAAVAGATFALVRTATTFGAVVGVHDGEAMSERMQRITGVDGTSRVVIALAAGILSVVAVASIALAARDDDGDATSKVPAAATEPTTTVTTTPETRALDDVLLDDTLDGFRRDDAALGAGALDLEAAAAAEPDVEAERALLETRGFVRGASRGWLGPGGETVYLAAYEFARESDALAYLEDGREHLAARAATPVPVDQLPVAIGFTTIDGEGDGAFSTNIVAFARGRHWFLVLVGSPGDARPVAEAVELATRQAAATRGVPASRDGDPAPD